MICEMTREETARDEVRRKTSAGAADRLRSQSKITAHESAKARAGSCSTHPVSEHVIWRSEVGRKVVAGGAPFGRTIRHVSLT
ncbi:MAG TPA: hypothetical protein VLG49_01565 [Rhabdochlamydiaceae bacterium]|nr:hypothetical protein [Rhabdochlamydiaceae bacterium]